MNTSGHDKLSPLSSVNERNENRVLQNYTMRNGNAPLQGTVGNGQPR